MASINYATREISCKIVYYGPGLSGKTTNLQIIHKKIPVTSKSEMVSLATETDRTLFFDFLPLDLGQIKGFATKFQLYTVPGQVYYNATRKLVLRGVDGVVFVADSQRDKLAENLESLRNLQDNLKEYGIDLRTIPFVLQYNKRDLPGVLSVEELNAQINSFGVPTYEAQAHQGVGVFTTLKAIGKIVIDAFNAKYAARQSSRRPGSDPAATNAAAAPQPAPQAAPQPALRPQPAPMPPMAPPPPRPMPAPAAAHPGSASGTALPPIARPAAPLPAPSLPPLPPLAPRPVAAPQMPPPPQAPAIPLPPAYAQPAAQPLPPPAPAPIPGLQPAPAPFLTSASAIPAAPAAPAQIPTASFLTGTAPAPAHAQAPAASGVIAVPGLEHGISAATPPAPTAPAASNGSGSSAARKAKIDGVVDPKDLDVEIARYERELAEQQAARQNPIRQQPHANPNLESDYPTNNLSPFLSPDELNKFKADDNFPTRKMPFGPGLGSQN